MYIYFSFLKHDARAKPTDVSQLKHDEHNANDMSNTQLLLVLKELRQWTNTTKPHQHVKVNH